MSDEEPSFADRAPAAWTFHRASSRWRYNMLPSDGDQTPEPGREIAGARFVPLPPPRLPPQSLESALADRASARLFLPDPFPLEALATVLHWGGGITGSLMAGPMELARRPCPSAGGLYPLELYLIARKVEGVEPAIYHYQPFGHGLEEVLDVVPPRAVSNYLFMDQPYVTAASGIVVITAVFDRSLKKYRDRGYRYLLLEAGHVAQNMMLAAAAHGLGSCGVGGFFDIELGQLMKLDLARELPIYAVACGPAET